MKIDLQDRKVQLIALLGLCIVILLVALVASGGNDESTTSIFGDTTPTDINGDEITDEDTQRWLDNWCSLTFDMDRAEVYEAMGPPTQESLPGESTFQPQAGWETGSWSLTAFFNSDDSIDQYQVTNASDPALDALPCGTETRFASDQGY